MIIDDDVELTQLLVEFLSKFKYDLEIFHRPLDALKFLKDRGVKDICLLHCILNYPT